MSRICQIINYHFDIIMFVNSYSVSSIRLELPHRESYRLTSRALLLKTIFLFNTRSERVDILYFHEHAKHLRFLSKQNPVINSNEL